VTLGEAKLGSTQTLAAVTIFIGLGSVSVFAPVVVNLFLGERCAAAGQLAGLARNQHATVMAVLLLVLGSGAFGKGLATLIR
jgi:hypothetical protein